MEKTSIDRAFEILDLFDEGTPTVSPEGVAEALGLTRSTTYRYIKVLCSAGLLMQISRGNYSLGPRIVELDRKIQISDPMLAVGRQVLPAHSATVPDSVLLLCGLWGERVLCLMQQSAPGTDLDSFHLTRARGMPFSLFKGAASLAILANLPPARIKSIYLKSAPEIADARLGDDWEGFRRAMLAIRKAGHCRTQGTFGSHLTAISAPILSDEGTAIGSLTRIVHSTTPVSQTALTDDIRQAATAFAAGLAARAEKGAEPAAL